MSERCRGCARPLSPKRYALCQSCQTDHNGMMRAGRLVASGQPCEAAKQELRRLSERIARRKAKAELKKRHPAPSRGRA